MRALPDPNLPVRESCDFIFESALCHRALSDPHPKNLANFLRCLIGEIYKLCLSCHLPEFTDHGLNHLCSLVDRISRWTSPDNGDNLVVNQDGFTPENASILLIATLIHDIGMLSQRPEDMPEAEGFLGAISLIPFRFQYRQNSLDILHVKIC